MHNFNFEIFNNLEQSFDTRSISEQRDTESKEENLSIFNNLLLKNYSVNDLLEGPIENDPFNFTEKFNTKKENEKKNLFNVNEKENLTKDNLINKKRKRGKKSKKIINNNRKYHDNNRTDNLLRKIQCHYMSFIVSYLNNILKNLNYQQKFLKLDYKYKRNVNKKFVESLKKKTVGDILCNKISDKYKHSSTDTNKELCKKIKNIKIFNNILDDNYLTLFRKVYYKSNKRINLNEYGLNKEIILSNDVKMFNDLLKDIKSNEKHQEKISESTQRNYLYKPIFIIN